MFYGAQVWGYEKFDIVEQIQRFFLKRTFGLPAASPNYMLYIETGLPELFTKTFKLHVDYIMKVMLLPNERLPKKTALYALQRNSMWFNEWHNLARVCGMQLNLSLENLCTWKKQLYEMLASLDEKWMKECQWKASTSMHRSIYANLQHNLENRNYFQINFNIKKISSIFRMRGELQNLN